MFAVLLAKSTEIGTFTSSARNSVVGTQIVNHNNWWREIRRLKLPILTDSDIINFGKFTCRRVFAFLKENSENYFYNRLDLPEGIICDSSKCRQTSAFINQNLRPCKVKNLHKLKSQFVDFCLKVYGHLTEHFFGAFKIFVFSSLNIQQDSC